MYNNNNRPPVVVNLGSLSASQVLPLLYAHKKMRVKAAAFIQEGAISVSGANYLALQLKKNNVAVGSAVDTQAGLAARTALPVEVGADGYVELEAGDYLSLDVAETGTFVESANSIAVLDVEIFGN